MKRIQPFSSSPLFCKSKRTPPSIQCLHTTPFQYATPLPITAAGPPPSAPLPAASQYGERADRRRRQSELLKRGQDLRTSHMKPGNAMKKRFWKDVTVKATDEGHHTIHLDTRPVRNPATKSPLPIPPSKPHLASAIALEWDLLVSAQQALRSHLIPLTSIASRAHDIQLQDSSDAAPSSTRIRDEIVNTLMRYLDTDTLLCWAPPAPNISEDAAPPSSLRDLQIQVAKPIIAELTQKIWPGIELKPTLDPQSIRPVEQPSATRAVIRGWVAGLPAWDLAGLERAVLAGKSLCVGARLVMEWSEEFAHLPDVDRGVPRDSNAQQRFGIEQAAEACSLEVRWQTRKWGEVEDSHDVEKEDLRRQFGQVVLVVSGTGGGGGGGG